MRNFCVFLLLAVGAFAQETLHHNDLPPPQGAENYFWKFLEDCEHDQSHSVECINARDLAHEHKIKSYGPHWVNRTGEPKYTDYKIGNPDYSKLRTLDRTQVCEFSYLPHTEYWKEFAPLKKIDGGFHQGSIVLCKALKSGTELNTPVNCHESCVDMWPIYNWNEANGENGWVLPDNLGYLVGPDTEHKFIGVASDFDDDTRNSRYWDNRYNNNRLNSVRNGFRVTSAHKLQYEPDVKVGLFMSSGHDDLEHGRNWQGIPQHQRGFVYSGKICPVEASQPISAFQYSVHTHPTVTEISIFIHSTDTNTTRPILHIPSPTHPHLTEKYFKFEHEVEIKPTDRIITKCTHNGRHTHDNSNKPHHSGYPLRWMETCAVDIWFKTTSRDHHDLTLECDHHNGHWDQWIWESTNMHL